MRMRSLITVFLVLALLPGALAVSPSLSLTLASQSPFPVEPGQNVEIELEIQNKGDAAASQATVTYVPKAPFSLLPGEEAIKTFVQIGPSSSVKTTYSLHVDSQAVSGSYELEFRLAEQGTTGAAVRKVNVQVQGRPEVVLETATLDPSAVEAGGTTTLLVFVRNVGTGAARYLTLTVNATPVLTPILSGGLSYLGDLLPGQSAVASIPLAVAEEAGQQTYALSLLASYRNESGKQEARSFSIGIPVSGLVKLDIINIEPDYARQTLTIEVANKGTADASSVEARLFRNGEVVDIDYISQIKSTKKTSFSFPLVQGGNGTLELAYTGPRLEQFTEQKDIVFAFAPPAQDGTGTIVVAVILLLVAGAWFYRRGKKRKKASSA